MEEEYLNDRERIFEFLYDFNPIAAEKTDDIITEKVEQLVQQPLMGVERLGIRGRLLIIPEINMLVSYDTMDGDIHVMRVIHQKQKFPAS